MSRGPRDAVSSTLGSDAVGVERTTAVCGIPGTEKSRQATSAGKKLQRGPPMLNVISRHHTAGNRDRCRPAESHFGSSDTFLNGRVHGASSELVQLGKRDDCAVGYRVSSTIADRFSLQIDPVAFLLRGHVQVAGFGRDLLHHSPLRQLSQGRANLYRTVFRAGIQARPHDTVAGLLGWRRDRRLSLVVARKMTLSGCSVRF